MKAGEEKMRITACSLIGQHQLMLKGEGRGGAKKKKLQQKSR